VFGGFLVLEELRKRSYEGKDRERVGRKGGGRLKTSEQEIKSCDRGEGKLRLCSNQYKECDVCRGSKRQQSLTSKETVTLPGGGVFVKGRVHVGWRGLASGNFNKSCGSWEGSGGAIRTGGLINEDT